MSGTNYSAIANEIGLTALREAYPDLTGAGVTVGQAEANDPSTTDNAFEVTPSSVGQTASGFFTFINGARSTTTYDDGSIGVPSSHATEVAALFYGATLYDGEPEGVAPGVSHVDNDEADTYVPNGSDKVVNLSFTASQDIDDTFDAAALTYNTVFVAAAGDSGSPASPSTAYNVISVAAYNSTDTGTAIGPAADGAAKPDITAPANQTSFSAPLVSGAAALLVQAGEDGIGGSSTGAKSDATDFRTIKALLLNGATKPSDYFTDAYAPTSTDPLNSLYGSGILNIDQSVLELAGGEVTPTLTASAALGAPSFTALGGTPTAPALGWEFDKNLTAAVGHDETTDTLLTLAAGDAFVATLTWAASSSNTIDTLDLTLYNDATGQVVAQSDAAASNVQQVYYVAPAAGAYELQVALIGAANAVTTTTYALAYDDTLTPACYARGTRIATVGGEVAVEALEAGDRVRTASGALRPVRWIGRRSYAGRSLAARPDVLPVRFAAGSLGGGLPRRDLRVSPEHAMFIDGVLIPARCLVNGRTIARERGLARIDYFHVELDEHDILLAEGAPSESYLDDGSRAVFDNAAESAQGAAAPRYCAPRIEADAPLQAVLARLAGGAVSP